MNDFVAEVVTENLGNLRGAAALDPLEIRRAIARDAASDRFSMRPDDVYAVAAVEGPFHIHDARREQRAAALQRRHGSLVNARRGRPRQARENPALAALQTCTA